MNVRLGKLGILKNLRVKVNKSLKFDKIIIYW
jgi:hypothetical protein